MILFSDSQVQVVGSWFNAASKPDLYWCFGLSWSHCSTVSLLLTTVNGCFQPCLLSCFHIRPRLPTTALLVKPKSEILLFLSYLCLPDTLIFRLLPLFYLLSPCHPAGSRNMCKELRSQVSCPGGQQRFHWWCVGQNHLPQKQPSNHRTRQSAGAHTGIGASIFLCDLSVSVDYYHFNISICGF